MLPASPHASAASILQEEMLEWQRLLTSGAYHELPERNRNAQLHFAIRNGFSEGALALLARGASPTVQLDGFAPLFYAAQVGDLDVCKRLIEFGAVVDVRVDEQDGAGRTPLCVAANNGHTQVCSYLLQQGADPNNGDAPSYQPLRLAIFHGHVATCRVLIDAGADPNRVPSVPPQPYLTPFQAGIGYGKKDIADLLLDSCPHLLEVPLLDGRTILDFVKPTMRPLILAVQSAARTQRAIESTSGHDIERHRNRSPSKGFSPL